MIAFTMYIFQRFKDCFTALLNLTQWAWSALKAMAANSLSEQGADLFKGNHPAQIQDLSRIVFVCRVSMRLLRFYILELYPVKSTVLVSCYFCITLLQVIDVLLL